MPGHFAGRAKDDFTILHRPKEMLPASDNGAFLALGLFFQPCPLGTCTADILQVEHLLALMLGQMAHVDLQQIKLAAVVHHQFHTTIHEALLFTERQALQMNCRRIIRHQQTRHDLLAPDAFKLGEQINIEQFTVRLLDNVFQTHALLIYKLHDDFTGLSP